MVIDAGWQRDYMQGEAAYNGGPWMPNNRFGDMERMADEIHARGAEVLMSSHTRKYMSAARILEIARAQEERGADIVKIVTQADSPEEEAEVLLANAVLKRELRVPFLLLCGGVCRSVRRIGPMFGSCMWLCVPKHDAYATKVQPLLSDVQTVKKGFEEKSNV
jgi:3-dehydroquinate dehydratase